MTRGGNSHHQAIETRGYRRRGYRGKGTPGWDPSQDLGMASPGVEYVPTPLETVFKLSRGPQRPYTKKSENFENSLI